METFLNTHLKTRYYTDKTGKSIGVKRPYKRPKYRITRYADDFVVAAETKEDIEEVIPMLEQWLEIRGLKLHPEKTRIAHIDKGFNFLGTTIRRFKGTCLVKPEKQKVLQFLRKIRSWLKRHPSMKVEGVIRQLNPILRGWGNYHRPWASKEVFSYMDNEIWKAIWSWCLKRHPQKGKRWVKKRYFQNIDKRSWIFATRVKNRHGEEGWMKLINLSDIQIIRHPLIKGKASPDNPEFNDYWQIRQARQGKKEWKKGSRFYRVAYKQNWKCEQCNEELLNGESIHLHHRLPIKLGGSKRIENLVWLHKICHQQIHSRRAA